MAVQTAGELLKDFGVTRLGYAVTHEVQPAQLRDMLSDPSGIEGTLSERPYLVRLDPSPGHRHGFGVVLGFDTDSEWIPEPS
jgi:hypothetical protein